MRRTRTAGKSVGQPLRGAAREVHRDRVALGEARDAAEVVVVLVGDARCRRGRRARGPTRSRRAFVSAIVKPQSIITRVLPHSTTSALPELPLPSEVKRMQPFAGAAT